MTSFPTAEQKAVIEAPSSDRLLVRADPGTGKTFTLVERSLALAARSEQPVLVLSFTRAVVAEIRRRAAEVGAPVVASTVDAFAAGVLLKAGREHAGSFDRTIADATALLVDEPELVVVPESVLVDEVQDLVGPRLDFVLAILRRADHGFSLFGDPRQAIYGFEDDSRDVFEVISTSFPEVKTTPLTKIHRARVAQLLSERRHADGPELLRAASAMSSIKQAALALRGAGDVVLLTRTNGEALALADLLAAAGTVVSTNQGAGARLPPPWIARFADAGPRKSWTRKQVRSIVEDLDDMPDEPDVWRTLRRIGSRGSDIGLQELRRAVVEPSRFDDFASPPGKISTIHRAKGLEWDNVIALRPQEAMDDLDAEERRVLFVAATRARRQLFLLERPDFGGPLVRGRRDGRWELQSWRSRGAMKFELRIGDVVTHEPFGGADAQRVQKHLRQVRPGDPVQIALKGTHYLVVHDDVAIARLTPAFSDAIGVRRSKPPAELPGGRILRVRTAAGDPTSGAMHGLSDTGLWLAPELTSLVDLTQGAKS